MKSILPILLLAAVVGGCAGLRSTPPEYSSAQVSQKLTDALTKLRKLKIVDGDAVYYAGDEGEFYKLSCTFLQHGTEDEFLGLLNDPNQVVRVMGMWCLNKTDRKKHRKAIKSMYRDKALVEFVPSGCVVDRVAVGEIARQIIKDPHLLEWRHHAEEKAKELIALPKGKPEYIPRDLEDCFAQLRRLLKRRDVKRIKSIQFGAESAPWLWECGLDEWLENNWELRKGSRLAKWFNARGVRSPGNMSSIILVAFWRHLNKEPIGLDEQIKWHQKWGWENLEPPYVSPEVELPCASNAVPHVRSADRVAISISTAGVASVYGEDVSTEQIKTMVRYRSKSGLRPQWVIAAEEETRLKHIWQVVDVCKRVGIWEFAFVVVHSAAPESLKQLSFCAPGTEADPSGAFPVIVKGYGKGPLIPEICEVAIGTNGLKLNRTASSLAAVRKHLRLLGQRKKPQPVVIVASDDTRHGQIVKVLDICAGLDSLSVSIVHESSVVQEKTSP